MCASIERTMTLHSASFCEQCAKTDYRLQKVGKGYAIVHPDGSILGTIDGQLPK
jgi:hypothetical protein